VTRLAAATDSIGVLTRVLRAFKRAGILAPVRPDRLVRMSARAVRLGPGPAALASAAATRWPDQPAIVDERGVVSYAELDRRVTVIAAHLAADLGVGPERSLAIMCRNHRGFVEALLAGSRLGADVLLLNTDFPGPQLAQVLERERPAAAVLDEEFFTGFETAGFTGGCLVSWSDDDAHPMTLDLLATSSARQFPSSRRQGRLTILTSGTTGTPRGAPRTPSPLAMIGPMTTLLENLPLRTRDPVFIGPPFFHGFGLAYLLLGFVMGATVVVRRRFDPEAVLRAIEEQRVTVLVGVPVMLQRIVALPEDTRRRYDTSCLRAAFSGGAPLNGGVSGPFMDAFGEIVHNGYGSSETGIATLATPADLRAAPGTVGRPTLGVTVKILDAQRTEVRGGQVGHVFIGGRLVFEGYSGGGGKETVGQLMNTGDLGHLDDEGRVHIDGREDDMIVSGGENVFPQEVAEVLAGHDAVADVAVFGVDDVEFGQRLRAYVVTRPGPPPTEEELKTHIKARVARYKVPREIIFLDELPRSPTGKVRRSELEQLAASGRRPCTS
jgi:acyl-CoA synthetase (AMP-forming)/AMP-acid ligase II